MHTIFASTCRLVSGVAYKRQRLELADGDFIDLDWQKGGHNRLALVIHGLEGNSGSAHMRGMIRAFSQHKWDAVAMNLRGCSGVPNRLLRSYHSGATEDIEEVLEHIRSTHSYEQIIVLGFSLGGNLALKYFGERGDSLPQDLKAVIAVSTPSHLAPCARHLTKGFNNFYTQYFLWTLKAKVREREHELPEVIKERLDEIYKAQDLFIFDEYITAPLNGFEGAEDYWEKCSMEQFLGGITRPALLITSLDDPFMTDACYPIEVAKSHPNFTLLLTEYGGHVGFFEWSKDGLYWSERQALNYLSNLDL